MAANILHFSFETNFLWQFYNAVVLINKLTKVSGNTSSAVMELHI